VEHGLADVGLTEVTAGVLTTTVAEEVPEQPWLSVTVTLYPPALPLAGKVGLCSVEVKALTPAQL